MGEYQSLEDGALTAGTLTDQQHARGEYFAGKSGASYRRAYGRVAANLTTGKPDQKSGPNLGILTAGKSGENRAC